MCEKKWSHCKNTNIAKHDSDDSFDIFSENQQSNKEIDLEGL